MSRSKNQPSDPSRPSSKPPASKTSSPLSHGRLSGKARLSETEKTLARAEAELHLLKQLTRPLPSLSDLILIRSNHVRAEVLGNLYAAREQATVAETVVDSIKPKTLPSSMQPLHAACQSEIQQLRTHVEDLADRAEGLRLGVERCTSEQPLLSVEQVRELSTRLIAYRRDYWAKLYELPFIQESRFEELSRVICSTEKTRLKPETVIFSYKSEDETSSTLIARAQKIVRKIKAISGTTALPDLPITRRREVAALLMEVPAPFEKVSRYFVKAKEDASLLTTLEAKVLCKHSSVQAAVEAEDLDGLACIRLQRGLGGSALESFEMISHLQGLQLPYINLKNYLTLCNKRLVLREVSRKQKFATCPEDMYQEGMIGLSRAIEKYDPKSEFRLATYALWWVKQVMGRSFDATKNVIPIPAHMSKSMAILRKALNDGSSLNSVSDLVSRTSLSEKEVRSLIPLLTGVQSLNCPLPNDSSITRESIIPDSRAVEVSASTNKGDMVAIVQEFLQILAPKEREVLELRFGLNNRGPLTLVEIGSQMGLTRERIRQIETKALQKIFQRSRLDDRLARAFFDNRHEL